MTRPHRIALIFTNNTAFGDEVHFFAATPSMSFKVNRDIEDLIIRVDNTSKT